MPARGGPCERGCPSCSREGSAEQREVGAVLHPAADCRMHLPAHIGDYTDFYVGIHHATNVGKLFRPDNPLLPNYKRVPIGYHGRASSHRALRHAGAPPKGQTEGRQTEAAPSFGPSRRLDYELELGIWVGPGNELGEPFRSARPTDMSAGFCLLNDWSARDIQSLGVPAARAVPVQELRDHDLALGHHARSAGALPGGARSTPRGRSAAAAISLEDRTSVRGRSISTSRSCC